MIKHRKIIICILLFYALFIVGILNVKAAGYYGCYSSLNNQWGTDAGFYNGFNICRFDNVNISSGSTGTIEMYLTEGTEMNGKTSTMVFRNDIDLLITGIYLVDNSNVVTSCELYSTNTSGRISSYNIICKNVKGLAGNGTKIVAHYLATNNGSGSYVFGISNFLTFDNETQAISNIQNKMDQDIDESDKEAPNQDEYNEAKEKEDNIIESINEVNPNDINFSQDIQATNKIWELTTKILQTNAKIMGLVISILSIGIIKLIMNR